ncbi:50S ribosomal protein L1 [Candidatus Carsonella ruddii]|uniref:Putative ribosomal protein L1 n=1 Tax=Candidatus Carsonella ruddii PC isolate NHV TaxID=1202540 RepID=J3TEU4_CARRU|nr:50S ribosomal protein L1 [Candidatus Carsonella ruddii]AFP84392.1 putative ribosomal protein L1 [Candidatus Carsonella ruddii PC isolate NHV]
MKKKINDFINYLNKKKKNFIESIDLNIILINKKKKYFNFCTDLFYSYNEMKKILFLSNIHKIENNVYYGNNYINEFLLKKVCFSKIFTNKENFFLIKNKLNKLCKSFIINCEIENYELEKNKFFNKKINLKVNKNNVLNIKIASTIFSNSMIIKNYEFLILNLKKNFFIPNNIFIEKIYISSTMSKSFLIK